MSDKPERPLTIHGLKSKRDELFALRRKLMADVKACERDIATLTEALRIFDPEGAAPAYRQHGTDRPPAVRRRLALDRLREAPDGLTAAALADAFMQQQGIEPTPAAVRRERTFMATCLSAAKKGGLLESEPFGARGALMWRIAPQ